MSLVPFAGKALSFASRHPRLTQIGARLAGKGIRWGADKLIEKMRHKRKAGGRNPRVAKRHKRNDGSRAVASGNGISTSQAYGAITQYRGKKMGGKKKRWRSFVKKVMKATAQEQAPRTRLFSNSGYANCQQDEQGYIAFTLNSTNGNNAFASAYYTGTNASTPIDSNDLYRLMNLDFDPTGTLEGLNTQLKLTSVVGDFEISNTGANAVTLDMYYVYSRKDSEFDQGNNASFDSMSATYENGFVDLPKNDAVGGDKVLNPFTIGVTPFDNPAFCERWKIAEKKRITLNAGAAESFIMKSHRFKELKFEYLKRTSAQKGLTFGVLVVFSGVTVNIASNIHQAAGQLAWNKNRTYRYRHIDATQASGTFDTS